MEEANEGAVRDAISAALNGLDLPGVVGSWVVAYEVSGITEGDEVGSNWGWLGNASIPTTVGLAHLLAADAPRLNEE